MAPQPPLKKLRYRAQFRLYQAEASDKFRKFSTSAVQETCAQVTKPDPRPELQLNHLLQPTIAAASVSAKTRIFCAP